MYTCVCVRVCVITQAIVQTEQNRRESAMAARASRKRGQETSERRRERRARKLRDCTKAQRRTLAAFSLSRLTLSICFLRSFSARCSDFTRAACVQEGVCVCVRVCVRVCVCVRVGFWCVCVSVCGACVHACRKTREHALKYSLRSPLPWGPRRRP